MRTTKMPGLLLGLLFIPLLAGAAVTSQLQQTIRDNTFEVVMKKPEKDQVTYEKPLPLELMPYIERTDAYRSMGTAFALGHNTYVTAGHVIVAAINSQFGPPVLRRADGAIFEIDRIQKYSADEDFVIFSLRNDPAPGGLVANRTPSLDQQVLAVGNALGEGIVIRDGLFTSETPEQQDGRWKWIRFSAAASPGNSGGPLCDAEGRVIGIVIGKSENENLNYSLPIGRALDGSASSATFDQRQVAGLPLLQATVTTTLKASFPLPLGWGAFVQAYGRVIDQHFGEMKARVLANSAATLFPKGDGSLDVLYRSAAAWDRPRLINQAADGTWMASEPDYHRSDLTQDGAVEVGDIAGVRLIRVIRPAHASDDAFYGDSKAFMDIALKGLDIRRPIGPDKVRVTSLGPAASSTAYTDDYGRRWQERTWAVPFFDIYLVAELLPTPDGYAGVLMVTPSLGLNAARQTSQWVAQHVDVGYSGTLAQWLTLLQRKDLLPSSLQGVQLTHRDAWTLQTPRVSSTVTAEVLRLDEHSLLSLDMAFVDDRPKVTWGVKEIRWEADDRRALGASIWRSMRPPASAKAELRNRFDSIASRRSPFDGSVSRESAEVFSMTRVLTVPGKTPGTQSADLRYAMTLNFDNYQSADKMKSKFAALEQGTQVLEHGEASEPRVASEPAAEPAVAEETSASWQNAVVAAAQGAQDAMGKDLRGRLVSDDLREFMKAIDRQLAGKQPTDAQKQDINQRLAWVQSYWSEYPALTRNRDMWPDFLRNNHLPESTPHSIRVVDLQTALFVTLSAGYPSEASAQRARELRQALIEERNTLVRTVPLPADLHLLDRTTPCGAPVTRVNVTRNPAYLSSSVSLQDLWPVDSKRLGEQGMVLVRLNISAQGCARKMAIVGSSGSERLDATVLKYAELMSFKPGGDDDGQAIETTVTVPVVFKLSE